MDPEDSDIEKLARDRKKEFQSQEEIALPEAKAAFHRFVETETDEVKRERLEEFIKFVDEAKTLEDVNWFREKAIKTAAASRALADKAILEEQARQVRRKQVLNAWVFGAILIAVIVGTGIGKTYYGVLAGGIEVEMESEKPETIQFDGKSVQLEFDHHGYAFNQHVVARLVLSALVVITCIIYTASKDI